LCCSVVTAKTASTPNSSLSTKPAGSAAQLTLMSGLSLRLLLEWMARAISSLPVPQSDLDTVLRRNPQQLLDVFPRRRQGGPRTVGERHPDPHEHVLQARRGDRDQHLRRLVAFVLEAVGRTDRHVGEHPRRRHDSLAVDRERDLAFEDVEAFLLPAV